jgi:MFS transporter, AAHS family, 4-hydroxybenzoate transporter
VIVVCTIGSAILTFAVGFAASPEQLIALRFVSGLAIGGLLAPVWALSIESMPRAIRAISVTIIMMGFSCGTASAGPIANWTAPVLGWEGIFWVCGIMTGAFALILFFMLPESARWAVATRKAPTRIVPMPARFSPRFAVNKYTAFILPDEPEVGASANPLHKLRKLFAGALALVTPLIWAAYFCSSRIYLMSVYAVIFMENLGIARQNAAWLGSAGAVLGALGGVLLLAMTEPGMDCGRPASGRAAGPSNRNGSRHRNTGLRARAAPRRRDGRNRPRRSDFDHEHLLSQRSARDRRRLG